LNSCGHSTQFCTGLTIWQAGAEHIDENGGTVFRHASRSGFEGIVSKRLTAPCRSATIAELAEGQEPGGPAMVRHREGRDESSAWPVRDALIAFMAATAQAQAEATKAAQRAGIDHAKARDGAAYLGRKPSYTRQQFTMVRHMLGQDAVGIARIAKETGLTRQTVKDPTSAEASLAAWGM
jgi:hypothetical protein